MPSVVGKDDDEDSMGVPMASFWKPHAERANPTIHIHASTKNGTLFTIHIPP
jgi:hypothetical protein